MKEFCWGGVMNSRRRKGSLIHKSGDWCVEPYKTRVRNAMISREIKVKAEKGGDGERLVRRHLEHGLDEGPE